jgi:hypothetical protein
MLIIKNSIAIDAEHAEALQHTQANKIEDKTWKEHRRHIRHLYTWWQDKYIDYFDNGPMPLVMMRRRSLYYIISLTIRILSTKGLM